MAPFLREVFCRVLQIITETKHIIIGCISSFSCKKLVVARKQMSVFQAPNVLVIQLKVSFYQFLMLHHIC